MIRHPLLAALSLEQRQAFAARCRQVAVKRGDRVVAFNSRNQFAYIIATGLVRVDVPGKDNFAPTGFLTASDLVIESLAQLEWTAQADYVAVLPTTCWALPMELCQTLLKTQPAAALAIVERCLVRIMTLRKELRRVNHESAEVAVGRTLYELGQESAGKRVVDRRVTQGTVAAYVGLSREQVNKTMRSLQEQGLLTKVEVGYEVAPAFATTDVAEL
jgi:CRP/FNR family transcriptional regulator, cyclic AMP receptor protein